MVKKIIFALVIVLLFIFLFVSAAFDTPIKVKTLADHKANIFIYKSGNPSILESYILNTDKGEVSVVYSSPESVIDIRVKITKDGQKVFNEFFEGYDAGKPINIRIDYTGVSGNYVEEAAKEANKTEVVASENKSEENKTQENPVPAASASEVVEEVSENNSASVTGAAIGKDSGSGFSNVIYYIIGGVLIAALIVLFIVRASMHSSKRADSEISVNQAQSNPLKSPIKQSDGSGSTIKPSNYSSALRPSQRLQEQRKVSRWSQRQGQSAQNIIPSAVSRENDNIEVDEEYIKQLESRIKEAERELNYIKNVEKIRAAEKKLEEDRRELERLKGGDNF